MSDFEILKKQIVEQLKPLAPQKVILFGSHAWGTPDKDSDLDIYVVTNDNFMPNNWKEKSEIYLKYKKNLDTINKQKGIDLIVHTKPMYDKFVQMDGMFCRKILQHGIKLYETTD